MLNVFPRMAINNFMNIGNAGTKFFSNHIHSVLVGRIHSSNFFNMSLRKNSVPMFNPQWCPCPTFFHCIVNIIPLGSNKQMARANTPLIITSVQNQQPLWNWAKENLIRKPMGSKMAYPPNAKASIPFIQSGCPKPTFFCAFNFRKKKSFMSINNFHSISIR